jgi:hypothetical protein
MDRHPPRRWRPTLQATIVSLWLAQLPLEGANVKKLSPSSRYAWPVCPGSRAALCRSVPARDAPARGAHAGHRRGVRLIGAVLAEQHDE